MSDVYFSGLRTKVLVLLSLDEAEDIRTDLAVMISNGLSSKLVESIEKELASSIKEGKKWCDEYGIEIGMDKE